VYTKNKITEAIKHGRVWEGEVFGFSSKNTSLPKYLLWQDALEDVVSSQSKMDWNPEIPKTHTSTELFACVQSYLPKHLQKKLKLYCALGTSLDYHYGVDGFFMIDNYIVTIDLTLSGKTKHKAQVLICKTSMEISIWRQCQKIAVLLINGLK
jgi:hypothetical protein